jgi:hypothetical protein
VKEWGLAVREESPNGGAKWWLAGGKWVAVAYLGDGENNEKKEASASIFLFIVEREREGKWSRSRTLASDGRRLASPARMWRSTTPISRSESHRARSV